ncbi:MAG: bifunctional pyr operon transcriptional regulator/uracil phosphoribosyltransferase PyrR [Verrucomicrobiae bacterium]|nr:bifunctional pyr operon transcriptional regulator/uracil phosphoribosyltransferase PyrR [Verrucomicrobiae bacterium]
MTEKNNTKEILFDAKSIAQIIQRMANELASANSPGTDVVLVGIQTGGVQLAHRLAEHLGKLWDRKVPVGQLDISMYRDDLDQRFAPKVHPTDIMFDVSNKTVILVDDVFFSGRTTRAALDALAELGRPKRIQLAVLIDRGHRELPIRPDFVGETVPTNPDDRVDVQLGENLDESKVVLEKGTNS